MDTNVAGWMQNLSLPPAWAADTSLLPSWNDALPPHHVHLVPSLSLGGAERIVADLALSLSEMGASADIAVMRDAAAEHRIDAAGIGVHRLGRLPWPERIAYCAGLVSASRLPAYCHLTSISELRQLWKFGVRTVPVVHNSRGGWKDSPLCWHVDEVPFVVACGEQVAEDLRQAGLHKPVRVLRHVVRQPAPMPPGHRRSVRAAFGAGDGTLLIGMTGRHAAQKRYVRAVRILAGIRSHGVDARLAIVGGASGEDGLRCRAAVAAQASALGVREAVILAGPVADAGSLAGAYDVFLNTSLWEGVSISTMEAAAAGVPVVVSDVGGQREAMGPDDTILCGELPDTCWEEAVLKAACASRSMPPAQDVARLAAAASWPWTLACGPGNIGRKTSDRGVLFVTGNMDVGGAQRSLCNLAAALPALGMQVTVAVCGPVGVPDFLRDPLAAGARFLDLSGAPGRMGALRGRAGRILALAAAEQPRALCFWNMDAATKMAVAKAMEGGAVRLVDVSPGPMLFKELDGQADLASRLSTSPDAYVAGLDLLVSKYAGGFAAPGRAHAKAECVIPNGVPEPGPALDPLDGPRPPAGYGADLAVVTVGRLVDAKRPELLPLVARALERLVPGASLTVVGGIHGEGQDRAWTRMLAACGGDVPRNLRFAGPDSRATAFLHRFAAFYMVSRDQGCPNASLEAMACGLPVVANPDGGTAEQVQDGLNGFLVPDPGDDQSYAEALAGALARLLLDPEARIRMGRKSLQRAAERFTMAAMARSYLHALLGTKETAHD